MTLTLLYLYIINVILSLSSLICIIYFNTRDYSKLKLVETFYVYWLMTVFSLLYGLLETFFIYQYNLLQSLRDRYTYFPYVVFIGSLFLTTGWLVSSVLSTVILKECLSIYDNCDIIISLTTFGFLELSVWIVAFCIVTYFLCHQKATEITVQEPPIHMTEIHMQDIQEIQRSHSRISYTQSVRSHHAEIIDNDNEMEEVKL